MSKMSFAQRIKQRAKEAEFSGGSSTVKLKDGVQFFKPKKGKNEIMIIPFEMDVPKNKDKVEIGDLWYRLPIETHYRVGAEDKTVICPRCIGKKCPICEHRSALLSQGRALDAPEVKELSPKKRELYWVVDLLDEESEDPKVFEASYFNFGRKLEEEIREADDESLAPYFADPEDGAAITVRMTEETFGKNKYLEAARFDFNERSKQEKTIFKKAMDQVTPFGEMIVVMGYDELKNLFYDISDDPATEPETDQEYDETPSRSRIGEEDEEEAPEERKRTIRGSEDGDMEEDEETVKPSRKSSKADEDDDQPVRRKKAAKMEDDEVVTPKRAGKNTNPECLGDGKFGESCDTLDECEDCPSWADCRDLTDDFEKSKKRKK